MSNIRHIKLSSQLAAEVGQGLEPKCIFLGDRYELIV